MVFKIFGLVRYHGKKIANGIDGRFETKDERIINILKMKGFEEIETTESVKKPVEVQSIPKEGKRVTKADKKVQAGNQKNR
jgi:hypothetical protein